MRMASSRRLKDYVRAQIAKTNMKNKNKYYCPYTYDRTPLQSAINVELQKSNSRMVLERTPLLEDLIESDLLKCELTVAKKRENAVESLQLLRIKPTRIHEEMKKRQKERNIAARPSSKEIKARKGEKGKEKPLTKKKRIKQSQGKRIRKSGSTLRGNLRNCLDLPPRKPPDNDLDDSLGTGKAVNMEVERGERIMAQKSDKSQNTSTSLVTNTFLLKKKTGVIAMNLRTGECRNGTLLRGEGHSQIRNLEDVTEKVKWEPPFVRKLKQE